LFYILQLIFAIIGIFIGIIAANKTYKIETGNILFDIIAPSILIAVLGVSFVFWYYKNKEKRMVLEKEVLSYKHERHKIINGHIGIKNDNELRKVEHKNIIYLSSKNRVCVVHSIDKDYEVHQLLGEMEVKLPKDTFLRIHKQYIVNTAYISTLRYFEGGRYMLHLSDDDESVLPIGKTYTEILKRRMNI
jgi:DNA-binding LytR/AlgR family response regulator